MKNEKFWKILLPLWAIGMSLFQIVTGYYTLPAMEQRTIHVALALPLVFFIWAQKKKLKTIFWLVFPIIAILGFTGVYVYSTYASRVLTFGLTLAPKEMILGIIFLAITIGMCWIGAGPIMTSIVILSILYARFGSYFPGILGHSGFSWNRIINTLIYSAEGIFGSLIGLSSTYIYLLILFGSILIACGGGEFVIDSVSSLVGRLRGGPAKIAVIASGFFGMFSGSSLANVAVTGSITIPLMKKTGYEPKFAGAVETAASSGGGLMPPVMGMVAFIMAEILEVPYLMICKAAVVPAVLYFLYLFFMVDFEAGKRGLAGLEKEKIPKFRSTFKKGWYYLIPILVFLYTIAILHLSLTRVGFWTVISTLLVAIIPKLRREGYRLALKGLEEGAHKAAPVIIILISAQIIISMLSLTALGLKFSSAAVRLSGGSLFLLLIIGMIASIILGMGLPIVCCYIIVAVFVCPSLVKVGIWPIAAHLFSIYYADMSAITPPVAPAAYVAAGIAKSKPFSTAIQATKLAIPGFFLPFMFVYRPALLLEGGVIDVLYAIGLAILGLLLIGGAMENYFFITTLRLYERVLAVISGILMIVPATSLNIVGVAGAVLFIVLILRREYPRRKLDNKREVTHS